jgi:hypothetical protein
VLVSMSMAICLFNFILCLTGTVYMFKLPEKSCLMVIFYLVSLLEITCRSVEKVGWLIEGCVYSELYIATLPGNAANGLMLLMYFI